MTSEPANSEPAKELTGVGMTALGAAALRAFESGRADRLFNDPYAPAFVAAAPGILPGTSTADNFGESGPMGPLAEVFVHAVTRTRFFDDYLLAATGAGCGQVVLVAAGLDTRAFRLAWPDGVRLFELDQPDVLAFKERVLADQAARPRCARTAVPVDLRTEWAESLVSAGFDRTVRTAWHRGAAVLSDRRGNQRPAHRHR